MYNVIEVDEWLNNIAEERKHKDDKCRMIVNGNAVIFPIDYGSTVNLLCKKICRIYTTIHRKILMWNKEETSTIKGQTQHR